MDAAAASSAEAGTAVAAPANRLVLVDVRTEEEHKVGTQECI